MDRKETDETLGGALPEHIAVIMDGNGRWARSRGLPRTLGHRAGIKAVRQIVRECARRRIRRLTLYAFSAENWKRPRLEVEYLMRLLRRFLIQERTELMENGVRLTALGRTADLPEPVVRELEATAVLTRSNPGLHLALALNYGGRSEIVDAVREIAQQVRAGRLDPNEIDETLFRSYLYDPGAPDPDLLIRTGGEMRISNFLLWQLSYAEIVVLPVHWPDFRAQHLDEALRAYACRERRFGGLIGERRG